MFVSIVNNVYCVKTVCFTKKHLPMSPYEKSTESCAFCKKKPTTTQLNPLMV